jgi:hypothetical protein
MIHRKKGGAQFSDAQTIPSLGAIFQAQFLLG